MQRRLLQIVLYLENIRQTEFERKINKICYNEYMNKLYLTLFCAHVFADIQPATNTKKVYNSSFIKNNKKYIAAGFSVCLFGVAVAQSRTKTKLSSENIDMINKLQTSMRMFIKASITILNVRAALVKNPSGMSNASHVEGCGNNQIFSIGKFIDELYKHIDFEKAIMLDAVYIDNVYDAIFKQYRARARYLEYEYDKEETVNIDKTHRTIIRHISLGIHNSELPKTLKQSAHEINQLPKHIVKLFQILAWAVLTKNYQLFFNSIFSDTYRDSQGNTIRQRDKLEIGISKNQSGSPVSYAEIRAVWEKINDLPCFYPNTSLRNIIKLKTHIPLKFGENYMHVYLMYNDTNFYNPLVDHDDHDILAVVASN